MERTMSVEERIRRAEDIYNKRNGGYSRATSNETSYKKKNKKGTVKRLFMQAFVCLSIYIIFYAVTNREYVFSQDFRKDVGVFFNEKTKISEFYGNAKAFLKSKFNNANENAENTNAENTNSENTNTDNAENTNTDNAGAENKENKDSTENKTETTENKDENIGGAQENNEQTNEEQKQVTEEKKEENKELSEQEQMEKEAKEIKEKISFIAPIKGRISSTFGWRNPTTASVPKYHTGVDIAANEGTIIKSATDGKVIMASSAGDYGNHYQIQIDDVIIVYAHCKKLYLKEGDTVKQGQNIAEVGSTGNSTGPHLHFEIRRNGKKIDPQLVVDI